MLDTILHGSELKSLAAEIKDAELQVLECQRMVIVRADTLMQKTQQQMTAPASLLLAGGIGFVIGELTKSKSFKPHGTIEEPRVAETTDITTTLMRALNQLAAMDSFVL
ncbi:MAG: hypothetical protein IPO71_04260 [Nitrosomonas sp.]|nr:hypothetical protein [Nitrosomonas sp.]